MGANFCDIIVNFYIKICKSNNCNRLIAQFLQKYKICFSEIYAKLFWGKFKLFRETN